MTAKLEQARKEIRKYNTNTDPTQKLVFTVQMCRLAYKYVLRHNVKILLSIKKIFVVAFPWVETSTGREGVWFVYYMTGTPEGSTESGFMEKPGIEPATPGLQGIALIHYTTGASLKKNVYKYHF